MKSAISIIFVAMIIAGCNPKEHTQSTSEAGIDFIEGSIADAMDEARQTNKLIFIDAYASWCRPCKEMEREVFSQQEVFTFYNKNFINVKLDIESKGDGTELSIKYNIREIPTYLFLNHTGELIHRTMGKSTAVRFLETGNEALKRYSGIAE